ncbi:MAG: prepilin-type N-terminal cleavage/methylation domain-containing protein [Gemmatimonadota bacterium]|jgi:prepilin-type N-terminal cleavage/methylation domain-containing protein
MRRREGFTVIELLIVLALTGLILSAAYRILFTQQRSARAQAIQAASRSSLRTALAVLGTELREAASFAGSGNGGSDLAMVSSDSVRFRALRQFAVICDVNKGAKWLDLWVLGETFAKGDHVMAYAEQDTVQDAGDDQWQTDVVGNTGAVANTSCATSWPGATSQGIATPGIDMSGVEKGEPVRGFEWVGYGLTQSGGQWVIVRRSADGEHVIAEGLAAPSNGAPLFAYYDSSGAATADPHAVAQIRMTLRTPGNAGVGVPPETLSTRLYLRNN